VKLYQTGIPDATGNYLGNAFHVVMSRQITCFCPFYITCFLAKDSVFLSVSDKLGASLVYFRLPGLFCPGFTVMYARDVKMYYELKSESLNFSSYGIVFRLPLSLYFFPFFLFNCTPTPREQKYLWD
jgi:hypothetical protein